jgi:poly-beta-1,6-N-acetyl-D-glucosamine synthase
MITWVVLIICALHALVFILLYFAWDHLKISDAQPTQNTGVTVIVPVRNESANIQALIHDLLTQDYPKHLLEIIIVDDNSEDGTWELIQAESVSPLRLPANQKGKKAAIELGVSQASHPWILTTDGDCRVPSGWVSAMMQQASESVNLVVGPVRMVNGTWFGALQSLDFTILIGYAASLVRLGVPSMSNGANLLYRRGRFTEVGGYDGNRHVPSGDDEFILLKIARKFPGSIRFMKSPGAVVTTQAKSGFGDFLNQRKRWLSKWTIHKSGQIILAVLLILVDNLAILLGWLGLAVGFISPWFLAGLGVRVFAKGLFTRCVGHFLGSHPSWWVLLLYELIYPPYIIVLSLASIFGHYTWKGRTYA